MSEVLSNDDPSSDSYSSDLDDAYYCLRDLEDIAQRSCACALAKCAPGPNVKLDVCTLYVHHSRKRHCAETVSRDSSEKKPRVGSASTEFHVLRPLLLQFSEYFRNCFKHDLHEKRHNAVTVSEFDEDVTAAFVYFLYAGRIRDDIADNLDLMCELARMGKYYQVTLIQQHCFAHFSVSSFGNKSMKPVLNKLIANGFELQELIQLGCKRRFLRQLRMTPSEYFRRPAENGSTDAFNALGFLLSHRELRQETNCVQTLRMRGWTTDNILSIGFSSDELRSGGFAFTPKVLYDLTLKEPRTQAYAVKTVIEARFSVEELLVDGFTSRFIQEHFGKDSHIQFRNCGYTYDQLLELGYAPRLLNRR